MNNTKSKWFKYGILGIVSLVFGVAVDAATADENWSIEEERRTQTKLLVEEVLADANSRVSLGAVDSPITLDVSGFVQTRFSYNSGGSVEANHGFDVPRARLQFSGSVYDFDYVVSGQWYDNNGGEFDLTDAYASTDIAGVNFKFGQFVSPFMKSWDVYAADTLTADRSLVTYTFGQGRSQGIQFGKEFGDLRLRASYNDGFNSANGAGVQNGYALNARADYDVTDWMTVGGAISWNDLDTTDFWTYTFDTGLKFGNFAFDAAYVGRNKDAGNDWATQFQASYFLSDAVQPFARYEYGSLPGEEDLSLVTAGFNYHFNDNVKWTTDVGYSLNGIGVGWDTASTGWNSSVDSGEYLVRTQIQIRF
tara:strand:- start:3564 stop:4655 length:1092 start_codon:yes stop_codon:yes gene_type:complete